MSALRTGASDWFESARSELTVLGQARFDDHMVRYRVAGAPDVHAIDRIPAQKRERALYPIAVGALDDRGGRLAYLGAEFVPLASVRRSVVAADGEPATGATPGSSIEETEFARRDQPGGAGKRLLRIVIRGEPAWYLVNQAELEAEDLPAPARAPAGAGARPGAANLVSNGRKVTPAPGHVPSEIATIALFGYFAISLWRAYLGPPAGSALEGAIQGMMVGEFIVAGASAMIALMRFGQGMEGQNPPLVPVSALYLVMGVTFGLALFGGSLEALIYIALLVSRMWTILSAPPERGPAIVSRAGYAFLAYLIAVAAMLKSFLLSGAIYFSALALVEAALLAGRPAKRAEE